MKPIFQLKADDQDITEKIFPHLTELIFIDNFGQTADTLTIKLVDPQRSLVIPEPDTVFELSLGYGDTLISKGHYSMNEVEWSDAPSKLTLKAATKKTSNKGSLSQTPSMQEIHRFTWPTGSPLMEIVKGIALFYGLDYKLSKSLEAAVLSWHEMQRDENDLGFLSRIVEKFNATLSLVSGSDGNKKNTLSIVSAEDSKERMENNTEVRYTLGLDEYTSISYNKKSAENFGSVIAIWKDADGKEHKETAGLGDPVFTLPGFSTSIEEARDAAKARLKKSTQSEMALKVILPVPLKLLRLHDPLLEVKGVADKVDGIWQPKSIEYILSREKGFRATIDCNSRVPLAKAKATPEKT